MSEAINAEQTARIVALESATLDHSTRIRTIEDAVLSISANFELVAKAARLLVGVVAILTGVSVGEMAGVID